MASQAMWIRDTKAKRRPLDEPDDPLIWIGLIFAAVLALVLVIQTTPAVRDAVGTQQSMPSPAESG